MKFWLFCIKRKNWIEWRKWSKRNRYWERKNLEKLKKKLRELKLNRQCSQKYQNEHKQKLDALDEEARKKVTGKGTSELGRPQKYDSTELIEGIYRIAIPGSATHERIRNEVIRTVKSLYQLTKALNYEGCDLQRSTIYLHFHPKNSRTIKGWWWWWWWMRNCFCCMVYRQMAFSVISSRDHCQRCSPSWSPTHPEHYLNLRRTWVQALLNEAVQ